jgi:hypothetical protein
MSNFYNQSNAGGGGGGGGDFYNSGGYGQEWQQPQEDNQPQQQQQSQQQPSFSQWQQPASSQTNMAQSQQQPAQQQASPAFWNPSTAAAVAGLAATAASGGFSNDAVLDWAVKGGADAWKSGGASMIPGFDTSMQVLRAYFAVDNRYVKVKMQKVLFPFISKQWRRLVRYLGLLYEQATLGTHLNQSIQCVRVC